MELQRGVIGDLSPMRELADEAESQHLVEHAAALVQAARGAGAHVVHCTAEYRGDGAGASWNAPLLSAIAKRGQNMLEGTADVELVPELGPEPSDLVCSRRHG